MRPVEAVHVDDSPTRLEGIRDYVSLVWPLLHLKKLGQKTEDCRTTHDAWQSGQGIPTQAFASAPSQRGATRDVIQSCGGINREQFH
jgi:hypothetical protein